MSVLASAFLHRFRDVGLVGTPSPAGDVERVELRLGVKLPAAYVAYLRIAGAHPLPAWVSTDFTIDTLTELQG